MINYVEIYTKPNCSYCTRAKKLLELNKIIYNEQKLDVHFTREHLKELFPTAKTFPVIVLDGYHIGGAKELEQYLVENYKDTTQLLNE